MPISASQETVTKNYENVNQIALRTRVSESREMKFVKPTQTGSVTADIRHSCRLIYSEYSSGYAMQITTKVTVGMVK